MTPFSLIATIIFFCAVVHTFLTPRLFIYSKKLSLKKRKYPDRWKFYHFSSEVVYLFSEVEVVFGIWLIPLLVTFAIAQGWSATVAYLNTPDYTYALYIMVIVVVVGSQPIINFSERILEKVAKLGKDTPGAWWWTILTIGPVLGALLKEPGAMTLSAILLVKKFYDYHPSKAFKYATMGLLFANISVGGMLTPFSSRALFIVADYWDWGVREMLLRFGWKAIIGILIANTFYYLLFRKEFAQHFPKKLPIVENKKAIPLWITLVHLIFVTLIAITGSQAVLFIGIFILFLGFHRATSFYQTQLHLKSAILVGFFFASLLIHGGLQQWWIEALMVKSTHLGAMLESYILSAFVDNAIVAYIAIDIPTFDVEKYYLIVAGAMAAGGLTLIANAPNPIGHALLRASFRGKISFFYLFLAALPPSLIFLTLFWVLHYPK